MMAIPCYVASSPIHGIGCFTKINLTKGDLVWQFDEGFDTKLDLDAIKKLLPHQIEYFLTYTWKNLQSGEILHCADHGKYFNHSEEANTVMSEDGLKCYACRDILAKEELTINYEEMADIGL